MKRTTVFLIAFASLLVGVGLGSVLYHGALACSQGRTVYLQPGDSVVVVAATCVPLLTGTPPPEPTATLTPAPPDTPTPTNIPAEAPEPPPADTLPELSTLVPTPEPSPSAAWYGVVRVPPSDSQLVADNLGGSVIDLVVGPSATADQINAALDQIQAAGYQAIVNIHVRTTPTRRPWYWNGSAWVFQQSTVDTLQGIAHHPAIFAIYALQEPLDGGDGYVSVEQQRELYQLLKEYTDGLPVFSDLAGLRIWEERGVGLTDGLCDYCGTFRHRFRSDWSSERCIEETLSWIDADLDTQQRLMPNSQVVFQIQTFSLPGGTYPWRLPTPQELATVRDHLCDLGQPMLYYPWKHEAYDANLEDVPRLWSVIAQGCDGQFIVLTQMPELPMPPTMSPLSRGIVIDHNNVDADRIPQHWLDQARALRTFFGHKSIGDSVLDGFRDLQLQNPTRYGIGIHSGSPSLWNGGISHRTNFGSALDPLSKTVGFDSLVRSGGFHIADVAMFKFCFSDLPCDGVWANVPTQQVWENYRNTMEALERDYPDTTFVWWTVPLNTPDFARAHCNAEKAVFNDLVRDYCAAYGCVLFDFADIQSHDPNGNHITSLGGHEAMWPGYSDDKRQLNEAGRQRAARAMWWLLVRVAGWEG